MTNHRCQKHGMLSSSQCDNILYSGLRCSNSVCLECTDYYEAVNGFTWAASGELGETDSSESCDPFDSE